MFKKKLLKPQMQSGLLATLSNLLCGKLVKSSGIRAKDVNSVLIDRGLDDILEDLSREKTRVN